jgi:hypothetical protein
MQIEPLFVITKSGLIIRPERIKDLSEYPKRYIREAHEMVDTYLREGAREHDPIILAMRREIARAQETVHDLEQLATQVQHYYDLNFVREAEIVRKTLHTLGFTQIQEVYILSVLVDIMVAHFKAENPTCNKEKFINYINNEGEAYDITTR